MSLAYLGTSEFAAGVLERLVADGHAPGLVVTRPDRPAGRGRRLRSPQVALAARELGLELHQPDSVNADERILACDRVAVCAFGSLIRPPLLDRDLLNVHPSLLPRWRGAAPIERAIMAGDERTGVAIMRITEGFDEGPVGLVDDEPIHGDDDFGTLSARLVEIGARLLVEALDSSPRFRAQGDDGVTYAEKISAGDRTLDPARPAVELDRVVRALHPHIGARLALADGSFLRVRRAQPVESAAEASGPLVVPCGAGALELVEVQPPGGRPMDAEAYARGRGGTLALP